MYIKGKNRKSTKNAISIIAYLKNIYSSFSYVAMQVSNGMFMDYTNHDLKNDKGVCELHDDEILKICFSGWLSGICKINDDNIGLAVPKK